MLTLLYAMNGERKRPRQGDGAEGGRGAGGNLSVQDIAYPQDGRVKEVKMVASR